MYPPRSAPMTCSEDAAASGGLARRQALAGVASGCPGLLADESPDGTPARDYIVTDGGVLYASADHGNTWCCYGLVDPQVFLLDLGFAEAWEAADSHLTAQSAPTRRILAA